VGETCPIIPGMASKAHWDNSDPPAADDVPVAFEAAHTVLKQRIARLVARVGPSAAKIGTRCRINVSNQMLKGIAGPLS
jgi:hypothetical protein